MSVTVSDASAISPAAGEQNQMLNLPARLKSDRYKLKVHAMGWPNTVVPDALSPHQNYRRPMQRKFHASLNKLVHLRTISRDAAALSLQ